MHGLGAWRGRYGSRSFDRRTIATLQETCACQHPAQQQSRHPNTQADPRMPYLSRCRIASQESNQSPGALRKGGRRKQRALSCACEFGVVNESRTALQSRGRGSKEPRPRFCCIDDATVAPGRCSLHDRFTRIPCVLHVDVEPGRPACPLIELCFFCCRLVAFVRIQEKRSRLTIRA